jgi:hypothetical protein
MFLHRVLHSPILLVTMTFFAVALILVIVDVIRYFGYYFRNHWTEATWIDDVTQASQYEEEPDDTRRKRSKVIAKK